MKIVVPYQHKNILELKFPQIEFYKEIDECYDADAVIGNPRTFTKENLEKLYNLKWIQLTSAGYDNIDIDYIKSRNILFSVGRDIYSIPISEYVLCTILMNETNAFKYMVNKYNKKWEAIKERTDFCGKTVAIIGTGSLATEIAKRLNGFGVKVLGYKRTPTLSQPYFDEIYAGNKGLEYVMGNSDYIVLTVDLNKDSHHMINKENLKFMKTTSSIINVARGSVINEQDLIYFLKNKSISYAALDVFETEPLQETSELWSLENVYITPHASGIVKNNYKRINELLEKNIQKYMDNEQLLYVIK